MRTIILYIIKGELSTSCCWRYFIWWCWAIIEGTTGKRTSKKQINKLYVKITVNDFNNPGVMIKIINTHTKLNYLTYSATFKLAQEIFSLV
ncbi:hypothetical protein [Clostridium perfringens]|uniref:Uncharacterized protein n=1 Tax=Clostridium perfringens TaxID=1502 RepID=A0AAP4ABH0_CLOPF|nr:hypothetical protein [Clostridium perfringens]MDH2336569.1 hypothetical protein [Clostridium perfringens]